MLINVILRNIVVTICLLLCASCATEYKVIDHDSPYFTEAQHEQFYVIGCGDRLSIKVWGKENLNTDAIVRPDGKISVPLIGDIQVRGLRVEDLKEELDKRFSEYVFEPSVSVTVVDIKSLKFYVLGEVTRPGEFDLIVPTDILRAIAMAGGFTIYAKKDNIQVIRTEGHEKIKIKIDYNQIMRGINLQQNILLRPGDVIIVP